MIDKDGTGEEFIKIFSDNGTGVEHEEISSGERIIDPFDPTLIRVDTRPMTIDLLRSRIEYQELDLAPSFQRKGGIWKDEAQSRLIESMLIRIPLPAFYMDATNDEKWLVVDGLQRLTTIKRFIVEKQLRLRGLEFLTQLEGKLYNELPRNYQRRIGETQVTVYLIEKGTPDKVKFNIFKRINTGGLPLSAQEIRHALNQGIATEFLTQLANSEEFKRATDYSIRDDRMADRECVLRFLAFTLMPYTKYDKTIESFDNFLNKTMKDLNKMAPQTSKDLQRQFKRAMNAAYKLFDKDAFRKRIKDNDPRQPINKALFESWSVNLNQLTDSQLAQLIQCRDIVKQKFIALMNIDRAFNEAISQGTGDQKKVKYRFKAVENIIMVVLSE
ncbi:MAG TPA: DUF262 domain-containing protein [Ktedonobacteraceae bacterium]